MLLLFLRFVLSSSSFVSSLDAALVAVGPTRQSFLPRFCNTHRNGLGMAGRARG